MSTDTTGTLQISERKEKHLTICTGPSQYSVEGKAIGFEGVRFVHDALPEIAEADVDTSVRFLDCPLRTPLFISCMTGGSHEGRRVNRELSRAAQQIGIPVGMGSIRVLLEDPSVFDHFYVKPLAPDVPVLANIGAVQIRDIDHGLIVEMLKRLEVQALVVHLNVGQELFQPEGDRDFIGLKAGIAQFCERSTVPVIVKETGFGIRPALIVELLDAGVAYLDVAGAGGTNWIAVESYRLPEEEQAVAREFHTWGIPTSVLLASVNGDTKRVLASGGLRTGMDVAKSLAMGAFLAGLALPFARAVVETGVEGVVRLVRRIEDTLRVVMMLTGSRNMDELRDGRRVWYEPSFTRTVEAYGATVRLRSNT